VSTYLAFTGGVGGAKLALGLTKLLAPKELSFVVNTGDDFDHLGFHICPDLDTLTYTLAGAANTKVGWGREDESWQFMSALEELGGETWFRLGDKDLALHTRRRALLAAGANLTEATHSIIRALGIEYAIWPMSNDSVRTIVHTKDNTKDGGALAFQHYFVRDRCKPEVTGFEFAGITNAQPNPALLNALNDCAGVIICPSNPYVSVDPILKLPGLLEALHNCNAPIVAVSPIVGGAAIKGPAAKMMRELQVPNSAVSVAQHYGELLSGFVLDEQDAQLADQIKQPTLIAQSVMRTLEDRIDLARMVLNFLTRLR
jgi:LPPG:FO 2-phospho-L-lactate transferase